MLIFLFACSRAIWSPACRKAWAVYSLPWSTHTAHDFHRPVPATMRAPVDGPGRVQLRQTRRGKLLSTLEHEVLSRHSFTTKADAEKVIKKWCRSSTTPGDGTNSAALLPPAAFEKITADQPAAA